MWWVRWRISRAGGGSCSSARQTLRLPIPTMRAISSIRLPARNSFQIFLWRRTRMAAPAFPLGRLGSGRLRRRYLSSKLPCHLFEQTLVVTKELLQCFGKILLKIKSIDNVFRLGSASRCGLAKELAAIARDDVHLGMVLKPGGT